MDCKCPELVSGLKISKSRDAGYKNADTKPFKTIIGTKPCSLNVFLLYNFKYFKCMSNVCDIASLTFQTTIHFL